MLITPNAIRELDNIYDYIANEKLDYINAKKQVDRIKKAILNLDTFPQSHQERNEGRYASCSSLVGDTYASASCVVLECAGLPVIKFVLSAI